MNPSQAPHSFTPGEVAQFYAQAAPKVRQTQASEWRGPCPLHDGTGDNFSVTAETGRWYCHSQCQRGGDIYEFQMAMAGTDFRVAMGQVADILNLPAQPRRHQPVTTNDYRTVAEYSYVDEAGSELFQVVRKESGSGPDRKKQFIQRHRGDNGEWIWNMKGVRLVPYQLPVLVAASEVLVVEGEKAVAAAEAIGFIATCNPQGAGKWRAEYAQYFTGKQVVILPDNDEPGRKHGVAVLESLKPIAANVRILNLPGLPPKGDIADWVAAGGTRESLLQLVEEALQAGDPDELPKDAQAELETEKMSELGLAGIIAHRHGANLRHVSQQSEWYQWSGSHWRVDHTQEVKALFIDTVRELEIKTCRTRSKIAGAMDLTAADRQIAALLSEFDKDDDLLNFSNGTLDLRNGELRPHGRRDLITKVVPFAYDPHARAPRWERFLREVFLRHPELLEWLQKAVGYSLTGDTREHCFFLMHGLGRNGKGVFTNTLRQIFGGYAHQADFRAFEPKYGDGPLDAIANLRGARLVVASESKEGARFDEALIKTLTGGDLIRARLLHQNSFEIQPTWKIWLATNYKPQIRGTDPAIWSRVRLIPFDESFLGREEHGLQATLMAEAAGIIAWTVEGAMRWREEGLDPVPEAVRVATEAYRSESDIIGRFLEDRTTRGEFFRVRARDLYRAYVNWADAAGEHPMKETGFGLRMAERGVTKEKDRDGMAYLGLRIEVSQ